MAPWVLARRSDATFRLLGPHPPAELQTLARPPAVEVAGFVPDLGAELHAATAFVAPIRSGGGMRVKLLEAMAAGCPVVTTALGLNGIPAADGREALVAETDEEIAAAALRLASDPDLAARIGAAGRALVEREFGVAAMGERREQIWRTLAGGR